MVSATKRKNERRKEHGSLPPKKVGRPFPIIVGIEVFFCLLSLLSSVRVSMEGKGHESPNGSI